MKRSRLSFWMLSILPGRACAMIRRELFAGRALNDNDAKPGFCQIHRAPIHYYSRSLMKTEWWTLLVQFSWKMEKTRDVYSRIDCHVIQYARVHIQVQCWSIIYVALVRLVSVYFGCHGTLIDSKVSQMPRWSTRSTRRVKSSLQVLRTPDRFTISAQLSTCIQRVSRVF